MHNLKTNFDKILEQITPFAQKMVNSRGNIPRRGVVPKFSDLEVVALSLTAETLSIDSENYLFAKLAACPSEFSNLISRCQYNQRRKYLTNAIRHHIAMKIDGDEDLFIIDSKPLPICRNARASRSKMGKKNDLIAPAFGYCATQKQYYYGYKMHLTSGLSGVIRTLEFSPASVADIHYLQDVKFEIPNSTIIADRAYLSATVQLDLFQSANIRLEVPYRHNQKEFRPLYKPFAKARKRIETTFSQLADQFMMMRNYAKNFAGFAARILAKITSFTMLQYLNFTQNKTLYKTAKYTLI